MKWRQISSLKFIIHENMAYLLWANHYLVSKARIWLIYLVICNTEILRLSHGAGLVTKWKEILFTEKEGSGLCSERSREEPFSYSSFLFSTLHWGNHCRTFRWKKSAVANVHRNVMLKKTGEALSSDI